MKYYWNIRNSFVGNFAILYCPTYNILSYPTINNNYYKYEGLIVVARKS